MDDVNDAAAARAVIEEYVNACNDGSVERLKAIFHPQALMSGYMMGDYLMGSPEPFFQAVSSPPPEATQLPETTKLKSQLSRFPVRWPV